MHIAELVLSIANTLVGAPVPSLMFIGMANTVAPVGGSLSRLATFSSRGMSAPRIARCTFFISALSVVGGDAVDAVHFNASLLHQESGSVGIQSWESQKMGIANLPVSVPRYCASFPQNFYHPACSKNMLPAAIVPCSASHWRMSATVH